MYRSGIYPDRFQIEWDSRDPIVMATYEDKDSGKLEILWPTQSLSMGWQRPHIVADFGRWLIDVQRRYNEKYGPMFHESAYAETTPPPASSTD